MSVQEELMVQATAAASLEKEFSDFLTTMKNTQDQIKNAWDELKKAMVATGEKQLKGEFGTITLVDGKVSWTADMKLLPDEFKKVVADTKKLNDEFDLSDMIPPGAKRKVGEPFLQKRLK